MGWEPGFTLFQAAGVVLLAATGALTGLWCTRVAGAYVQALASGGDADAASMRLALWHAVAGTGLAGGRAQPPDSAISPPAVCAALMSLWAVALNFRYGYSLYFLALLIAGAILLVLALIDARLRLLPDALTLPLLWLGLAAAWGGYGIALHDAVAGAIVGYGVLWLLFWLVKGLSRHEGMGYGDFKLLAALGAWLGWQALAMVLLAACVAGILFAMYRQKTLLPTGSYPFGPFLAASGMAALIAGTRVHLHFW